MDQDILTALSVPRGPAWLISAHCSLYCALSCGHALNDLPKLIPAQPAAQAGTGNSVTRMVSGTSTPGLVPEWPQGSSSATPRRRLDTEMLLPVWCVYPDSELWGHSCCHTAHALQRGGELWTNPIKQPQSSLSLWTAGLTIVLLNLFPVAKINCFTSLSWKFLLALVKKKPKRNNQTKNIPS